MNYRQLPASSLRNGRPTWVQLLVAGLVVVTAGQEAQAARTQDLAEIAVTANPFAPLPLDPAGTMDLGGTGLCAAYRTTTTPDAFFPPRNTRTDGTGYPGSVKNGTEPYTAAVNAFMDGMGGSTQVLYETLLKPFDLAAFGGLGLLTYGDYFNTPDCAPSVAGCAFPRSGPNDRVLGPFGSRYRGFFRVTNNLVGQKIHFGFTTNSSVALRFWAKPVDGKQLPYELIVRAAITGVADFRVTNTISFKKAGLYAVEVLHASSNDAARLEMAYTTTPFDDVDERSGEDNSRPLNSPERGSARLTTPAQFFQRLDGTLSFPGKLDMCQQCPREFAGAAKSTKDGCPDCMACNDAALCQVCNTPDTCGCSCKKCDVDMPYCSGNPADPMSLHCVECEKDEQCGAGQNCVNEHCVGFCPCCDAPKFCAATDVDRHPAAKNCTECRTSTDCPDGGYCDRVNARCLPKAPEHSDDKDCGLNAVNCIVSTMNDRVPRPLCMNGEVCVQCRIDADCDRGNYCRSGDCIPCRDDRHCGPSCGTCGRDYIIDGEGTVLSSSPTDTPVCYAPDAPDDKTAAPNPTCVQCLTDAHCGDGGECDLATHKCITRVECNCPANQTCSGGACAECITSSQCPCGQCAAGVCTKSCGDTSDCLSNQCCSQETATCISGRCKPGLTAHGGALCCDATAGGVGAATDPAAPVRGRAALWLMLGALMLLAGMQLRALRLRDGRRGRE